MTAEASEDGGVDARVSTALIKDVAVSVEALLGPATMTVGELTGLEVGAVVPLDMPVNHPVDLRLNGVTIARGELVSLDGRFGICLSDIARCAG